MGDYNRNDRGGGRGGDRFRGRNSGGRRFGGGGDFGRREMHHATCAQCGKDCEVPFLPKSDRPVYCSECFEKRGNRGDNPRRSDDRNFERPNFEERRSYPEIRGDNGQLTEQIKNLNSKLDKIISLLTPKVETSLAVKDEVTDIVLKPKAVKPKATKKKVKAEKVEPEKSL